MSERQTVTDNIIPRVCAVCKQRIKPGTPHYVSSILHPRMFYPRVHVEELGQLEQYEALMRKRIAQCRNPMRLQNVKPTTQ